MAQQLPPPPPPPLGSLCYTKLFASLTSSCAVSLVALDMPDSLQTCGL